MVIMASGITYGHPGLGVLLLGLAKSIFNIIPYVISLAIINPASFLKYWLEAEPSKIFVGGVART